MTAQAMWGMSQPTDSSTHTVSACMLYAYHTIYLKKSPASAAEASWSIFMHAKLQDVCGLLLYAAPGQNQIDSMLPFVKLAITL